MTLQEFVLTLPADRQKAIRAFTVNESNTSLTPLWRPELVKLAAYGNTEAAQELKRRAAKRAAKRNPQKA